MKRLLLILVLLWMHLHVSANDLSKQLCSAISQHKYAKALKIAENIDQIPEDAFVLISDLQEFVMYASDKPMSSDAYYTLLKWYAAESQATGDLFSLSNESFADAEYWYQEAADVYEVLEGDTSALYVDAVQQLFELYSDNDSIDKAIVQLEKIINIYASRGDTVQLCAKLNTYGFLLYRKGENQHSDELFSLCDSIVGNITNADVRKYIDVTFKEQRALLYFTYRDFDNALQAYRNLKQLVSQYYNDVRVVHAIYDTYIGTILFTQKDLETAESTLSAAYNTLYEYKDANEQLQACYTMCAFAYGRILFTKSQFDEAENILAHIVNLKDAGKLTDADPQYIGAINELAIINWIKGDYATAEKYINECVEANEALSFFTGADYYPYVNSVFQQSVILRSSGKLLESYKATVKSYAFNKALVKKNLSFLSGEQRSEYWNTIQFRYTDEYPGAFYSFSTIADTSSCNMYDNELFYKSILLKSTIEIQNAILQSGDSVLITLWHQLHEIEAALLADNNNSPELIKRRNDIDKLLTNKSKLYRQAKESSDITWRDVQNQLSNQDVAIEFTSFRVFREHYTDSVMYCALLLRNDNPHPQLIPLFEEKGVSPLINTTVENQINTTYSYDGNGVSLQQLVWSKVLPYVKQGETIYFAPSGLLHQLAIEALPYDETHTMADMFNLVRLSSTREIVLNKAAAQHSTATLYGGIQYNMTGDELLAESEQYATSNLLASRGIEDDALDRGSVKYLPGTKKEVESINRMLHENNLSVKLYTSTTANEESFKAISGKHQNILHIATHGFYWADSTAQKKDYFSQRMLMMDDKTPTPPSIDPLNRCGLLFAGANTALSGHSADLPEGVQDGILTAKEISLLDLRDADLVVLSACETGKGEITGEGVFGLQRAFKQAGAQTIIMSLWPVNDAATQLLMTEFYRNWITNHQSKREAFRNAQNTVRSQYEEPVYWAGFIMLD